MEGSNFWNDASCSFIGDASLVPVIFPPGFSTESTKSASTGSVTALNNIGISEVACFELCAAGVAIAYIRSTLSFTNP